eukprot:JP446005.1.p1 GENE.JP446005.1~~JP446005.1.p1  ORF type:complete len:682 (+),score=283.22 JP446005.1:22-2046(+)
MMKLPSVTSLMLVCAFAALASASDSVVAETQEIADFLDLEFEEVEAANPAVGELVEQATSLLALGKSADPAAVAKMIKLMEELRAKLLAEMAASTKADSDAKNKLDSAATKASTAQVKLNKQKGKCDTLSTELEKATNKVDAVTEEVAEAKKAVAAIPSNANLLAQIAAVQDILRLVEKTENTTSATFDLSYSELQSKLASVVPSHTMADIGESMERKHKELTSVKAMLNAFLDELRAELNQMNKEADDLREELARVEKLSVKLNKEKDALAVDDAECKAQKKRDVKAHSVAKAKHDELSRLFKVTNAEHLDTIALIKKEIELVNKILKKLGALAKMAIAPVTIKQVTPSPTPAPTASPTPAPTPAPTVPPVYYGSKLALKTHHGKFIVAEGDGSANANSKHRSSQQEAFTIINAQATNSKGMVRFGDTIALKSYANKWVVAEKSGEANANRVGLGPWEKFTILSTKNHKSRAIVRMDDSVAFHSVHGKYLVAENDGRLRANRPHRRSYETFYIKKAVIPPPKEVCMKANWVSAFDKKGWSKCPTGYAINGLVTSAGRDIYHLEEGKCCKPASGPVGKCTKANWWGSLDKKGWSLCPNGSVVSGLYRNSCHSLHCVEEGSCCSTGKKWGKCINLSVEIEKGTTSCPKGYYLAGLHRNKKNNLNGIDRFKCCQHE